MATGDTHQTIYTKLYIASGKPATEDQAGYEALTWTRVVKPLSIPERGDSTEDVSVNSLDDGRVEHFNGVVDGGVLDVPFVTVEGDAGQAILLASTGGNTTYSFKEESPDATVDTYYFGRISAPMITEATPNGWEGFTTQIRVNSARVIV